MDASTSRLHAGWDRYYSAHVGERAWNGVPDGFLMERFDDILRSKARVVVDIASGDGRNSEPFLDRDLMVVSIDLSPSALKTFSRRCRNEGRQQPFLIACDFLSLDLVEGQADCVVCFNSVPHFNSPGDCITKIVALLKLGARAAFNAFTPGDVAFGQGERLAENRYAYEDTLFTFLTEQDVRALLPASVDVVHAETRRWEEPDHGSYRVGPHTHEACFFIVEKKGLGDER